MKEWVILKRTEGEPEPGEYRQVLRKDTYGDIIWCSWACPTCKAALSIGKKYHTVNYLGELDPMVKCPKHCGFSNWVMLEDWRPEAQGQA